MRSGVQVIGGVKRGHEGFRARWSRGRASSGRGGSRRGRGRVVGQSIQIGQIVRFDNEQFAQFRESKSAGCAFSHRAVVDSPTRLRHHRLGDPPTTAGPSPAFRDAALLAVASDGLLRVSEVAALDVGDVQAEADGSGRLFVGASKTDQEGRGAVLYLGALTVSRVNAWLAAAGHQDRAAVSPRSKGRPLSASRAGYPVTVSELVARNRWPPAGPRLSRCRRRAGGSHRRCRATMHEARWQHGAPSLASATVADKAGVRPHHHLPRRRGVDLAGNDGTSSSTSGGSGWVSCARRSSWGLADLVGNVVGRGAPWGHVQSAGGPCIGVSPYSGLYVISPQKSAATVARIRSLPRPRHAMDNSSTTFDNISRAKVKWCVNDSGGDLLPLRDG